jgi:hypothetical protein
MYKVMAKRKVFYFADWESACEFCLLSGIPVKHIQLA